ncbi:MAG: glycosyltransferase family 4 protein [Candidatus Bathyarchaeota archaeon]|nr:glycosyltransferase family 4 protein [Candidatus Bathyarchaeota archaeon]
MLDKITGGCVTLKILQVAERTHPARGGVELHTAMISKQLVERGHDVTLVVFNSLDPNDCGFGITYEKPYFITRPRKPSLSEVDFWKGVKILRFPSEAQLLSYYWSPMMLHWLVNHIHEFDVVHTHCFRFSNNEFATLASLLRNPRVPIVFTCHDAAVLDYMGLRARLLDGVYRRTVGKKLVSIADRLIALTETNAKEYENFLFADPIKIRIVPNGIDFEKYQNLPDPSDLKKQLGNPEQILLFIGRFLSYKNPDKLILAFREIRAKFPNSHLVMIGKDYGLLNYCKKLADGHVTIFENASEELKLRSLAMADLCVIPSSYEGFGIVALEAQAAGVPVIATKSGGLTHCLIDKVTGYHIKSPTSDEIVSVASFLLDHPELRKGMGRAGKKFSKEFSWNLVAEKLENIYGELV